MCHRLLLNFYHKLFYVDVVGTALHQKGMMLQPQVQRKPREITNLRKPSGERWMNCGMVSHIEILISSCALCSLINHSSILTT